jgi:hypothetical protein
MQFSYQYLSSLYLLNRPGKLGPKAYTLSFKQSFLSGFGRRIRKLEFFVLKGEELVGEPFYA